MTSATPLTPVEQARYSRQMLLPQVGPEGQQRLRDARVLVVGAGGLGAPVSLYLAAAGVGHITLLDNDVVELSNLQRQIIFDTASVGQPKAVAAAQRLRALNPEITVVAAVETLTVDNAESWITSADLVLDCCDNFPTRYLINDFCHHLGTPWLFAALHQFRGHFALFSADTACFRCLYPRTPVTEGNCSLAGVMGTVPGLLGLWQANEAIKHLLRLPDSQPGHLWNCDALRSTMTAIRLVADPTCWCGQKHPDPRALHTHSLESWDREELELTWHDWQALATDKALLLDVRSEQEHRAANAGGEWLAWPEITARLTQLGGKSPVGLYCQRGQRSLALARELRAQGFRQVFSIRGGLESHH